MITDLHTDKHGFTWHILVRDGGSVSLYVTKPGSDAHYIMWDSLDVHPPTDFVRELLTGLAEERRAIDALLTAVERQRNPLHEPAH